MPANSTARTRSGGRHLAVTDGKQKFDGLSDVYERFRPRYPPILLREIANRLPARDDLHVIDTGAGTGVELEGLIPLLGRNCRYEAVDLSADMVATGKAKFPHVEWCVAAAEPFLEQSVDADLIIAAQSFQWMDRPRYLAAAKRCLNPLGVVAIIQNNRKVEESRFLDEYEALLEELSPGYSRSYRTFDYAAELAAVFSVREASVHVLTHDWSRTMSPEEFTGLAVSSTYVQRAIAEVGRTFGDRLSGLLGSFAVGDSLTIPYRTELVMAQRNGRTGLL